MSLENLKALTDEQLHFKTIEVAGREREVTLLLLKHLNEVEFRHLFSKYGCSSLHSYCVKELKMSDAQAGRRIAAARLLCDMPKTKEKLLSGDLTLTSAAQAKVFFSKEARAGNKIDPQSREMIVESLELKSTRKVTEILISNSAQPELHLQEVIKQKTETHTEVRLFFDQDSMNDLERLKEIWSHATPQASLSDLIKRSVREAVERNDPMKKAERAIERKVKQTSKLITQNKQTQSPKSDPKYSQNTASEITHRSVGAGVISDHPSTSDHSAKSDHPLTSQLSTTLKQRSTRRENEPGTTRIEQIVLLRDGGCCGFTAPRTGEICGSKYFLEFDHIVPVALGGETTEENLRLRCRAHNFRHAVDLFGHAKMQAYRDVRVSNAGIS